jgi:hypothetical protein
MMGEISVHDDDEVPINEIQSMNVCSPVDTIVRAHLYQRDEKRTLGPVYQHEA